MNDKRKIVEGVLAVMEENDVLFFDGLDDAIVGLGMQQYKGPVVVYDRTKCIEILTNRDGMTPEEAEEFFSFNTEGAWVGEKTPFIIQTVEELEDMT